MTQKIDGYETTYEILTQGSGKTVQKNNVVTVHATGVVKESQKKFWSTKDPGQQPFSYTAGIGQVITGWDQGLLGMMEKEERKVTIPAKEGYGSNGFPAWGIPPGLQKLFPDIAAVGPTLQELRYLLSCT